MYLAFTQTTISDTIVLGSTLAASYLESTFVEFQAGGQNVRYTMDAATDPTQSKGMLLIAGCELKLFQMEDFTRARFIRGAGSDATLNAHFIAGRDT